LVSVAPDQRLLNLQTWDFVNGWSHSPNASGRLVERAKNVNVKGTSWSGCSQFRKSCNLCATFGVWRQKIWAGLETMRSQPNTPNERRSSATERSYRPPKPVRAGAEREIKI